MNDIKNYIEKNLELKNLNFENYANYNCIKHYYNNAKADAIHCYQFIKEYLHQNKKILEVGGGAHLLTSFLNQEYDVTSVEPGEFTDFSNELRNKILSLNNLKVHTTTLESFKTDERYDLIFSMNVLEHTDNIEAHLRSCINLLKDENSILLIQCPNYTFPFECHFYKWFIPFLPNFTFAKLRRKSLIKELGQDRYYNILNSINFDCTYSNINKLPISIQFKHPLQDILNRLDNDALFRHRLCANFAVRIFYQLINFLKLKKLLIYFFPKFLCPYLIFKIKKKV